MNNETRASESVTSGSRGPSRRTLVRTAAWSVPVISTAAAAPAFAAASDTLAFSGTPTWQTIIVTGITKKLLSVAFSVVNNSTTDAAQNLTVNLTFSPTAGLDSVTFPSLGTWTVASQSVNSVTLTCPGVAKTTGSPFTILFTYWFSIPRTVQISGSVTTVSAFTPQLVNLTPTISSSN